MFTNYDEALSSADTFGSANGRQKPLRIIRSSHGPPKATRVSQQQPCQQPPVAAKSRQELPKAAKSWPGPPRAATGPIPVIIRISRGGGIHNIGCHR